MKEKRRTLPRLTSQLESLDSRVVPSAVGMAHAVHTSVMPHVAAVSTVSGHVGSIAPRLNLDALRAAMSARNVTTNPVPAATTTSTTTTNTGIVKNSPLAKAGQTLIVLYQNFQANGSVSSSLASVIHVEGSNVGVDVRGSGNVSALAAALTNLGMTVETTDARSVTVEGSLPISQLPAVTQLTQVISVNPISTPPTGPPVRLST